MRGETTKDTFFPNYRRLVPSELEQKSASLQRHVNDHIIMTDDIIMINVRHAIWDPHFGQPVVEAFTR
jgi:hypothetical protein